MKKSDKKQIVIYGNKFAILVPIIYEHEEKPAWRKVFVGTEDECKENFDSLPDFMFATYEENRKNRQNAAKEYIFLLEIGKKKKAEKIKEQYIL